MPYRVSITASSYKSGMVSIRKAEAESALERATQIGQKLFADESTEPRSRTGLLRRMRRLDADGEWERRCRRCGDFAPEHPEFFSSTQGRMHHICRECEIEKDAESKALQDQRRRALKKKASVGTISKADINLLYEKQGGKCFYCTCPIHKKGDGTFVGGRFHIEHVIPLAKGGVHSMENIVLACPSCNSLKGAKLPEQFMKEQAEKASR